MKKHVSWSTYSYIKCGICLTRRANAKMIHGNGKGRPGICTHLPDHGCCNQGDNMAVAVCRADHQTCCGSCRSAEVTNDIDFQSAVITNDISIFHVLQTADWNLDCHVTFIWLSIWDTLIRYTGFYGYFLFFMHSWLFQHDYLDSYCFECLLCMCFCIFVFAPVQRNWACFTWKGALEIRSLLLLLLL